MNSVAVIGDPVLDQIYHTDEDLVTGGKLLGAYFGAVPGGTTANFACAAARFGLRSSMFGRVADNWEGDLHRRGLEAYGVGTDHLQTLHVDRGAHTVIAISPNGEKTLIYVPFPDRGSGMQVNREALFGHDLAYVMAADFERLGPLHADATAEICVDVDAAAGLSLTQFKEVAKAADIVFINDVGFTKLMGHVPDMAAISVLVSDGPSLVCCTGGAGKSFVAQRDGAGGIAGLEMSALPANVVDTTGAGDCFNAAFLARRAQGASLEEALAFAMAAGALATERTGARESIPTLDAVLNRMKS